jgi:hypothetical protein
MRLSILVPGLKGYVGELKFRDVCRRKLVHEDSQRERLGPAAAQVGDTGKPADMLTYADVCC